MRDIRPIMMQRRMDQDAVVIEAHELVARFWRMEDVRIVENVLIGFGCAAGAASLCGDFAVLCWLPAALPQHPCLLE
jgi:hypothetical protein